MKLNPRNLQSIIDNEALAYAMYTVEERAIPNMMDGLKPVQRFVIYRALQMSKGNKEKFHKVASVAGGVSDAGYHHGEGSAAGTAVLMANNWNNNCALLDGQGNFGSRLVQEGGAPRYVYCRVSDAFRDIYKDTEYAPVHKDLEHLPPKHYLPIIPTVLLNGVKGIATGYSTSILPHSLESVVECTKLAIQGKLDKEPTVQFPKFKGQIVPSENGVELRGVYRFISRTQIDISEIPYKWERTAYVDKILEPLVDKGYITYDDQCGRDGFGFRIKLRKDYVLDDNEEARHERIMKDFGLIQKVPQFIVVIDENGKLRDDFTCASDLIKHFVEVRKTYIKTRIESKIIETEEAFDLAKAKAMFISRVIKNEIVIQGKTRKQLSKEIESFEDLKDYVEKLVSMNIYHITNDEAKKLVLEAKRLKEEREYWKKTTPEHEYTKDLEELQ